MSRKKDFLNITTIYIYIILCKFEFISSFIQFKITKSNKDLKNMKKTIRNTKNFSMKIII